MPGPAQAQLPFELDQSQRVELGEDCQLQLLRGFVADDTALLATLERELPWAQEIYLRDRVVPAPRLTSFHGDRGCCYTYSGIRYEPAAWTEPLSVLRQRLLELTGDDFNSVLANLYRDGRDSVGFHADDEPELGPARDDVAIASLSLGAARRFVLKHKKDGRRLCYELGHGDLLLMRGRTQQRWVHGVPKTTQPVGARINLTYRIVKPQPRAARSDHHLTGVDSAGTSGFADLRKETARRT
jgi:alkylated DNA repair dioxygenase AlkB